MCAHGPPLSPPRPSEAHLPDDEFDTLRLVGTPRAPVPVSPPCDDGNSDPIYRFSEPARFKFPLAPGEADADRILSALFWTDAGGCRRTTLAAR